MSYSHNRFLKETTTDTTGTTDVHTHENLTTNEMLQEVTTRLSTVEDTISNLPTVDLSSLETSTQNITTRLSTVEKKTVLLSCTGATTFLSGPLILNTNKAEHNIVGLLTNSDNVDGDSFKIWTNVYGQGGGRINSMCPEDTNTSNTNASITTAGGVHIGKNLNVSSINNLPPVGCVKIITPISLRNIMGSQTIFTQSLDQYQYKFQPFPQKMTK